MLNQLGKWNEFLWACFASKLNLTQNCGMSHKLKSSSCLTAEVGFLGWTSCSFQMWNCNEEFLQKQSLCLIWLWGPHFIEDDPSVRVIEGMRAEEKRHLDIMERLCAKHHIQPTIWAPWMSLAAYALGLLVFFAFSDSGVLAWGLASASPSWVLPKTCFSMIRWLVWRFGTAMPQSEASSARFSVFGRGTIECCVSRWMLSIKAPLFRSHREVRPPFLSEIRRWEKGN